MKSVMTRLAARIASLNDVSRLCFTTSSVFAVLGAGGWFSSYLNPSASRISVFFLISGFYLTLGLIGQWKASRATTRKSEQTTNPFQIRSKQISNQQSDRAA